MGVTRDTLLTGRLRDAGVSIYGRTRFTLQVRDPDGRRVGLSTYRDP